MTIFIGDKLQVRTEDGVFRGYVERIEKHPDFQQRHLVNCDFDDIPPYHIDGLLELGDIVITLRTLEKENR